MRRFGKWRNSFFRSNVAVGNLKFWLLLSVIADAREEQGEQDFGEAVVTADGLVLMYGLYSRQFAGPVTLLTESAF